MTQHPEIIAAPYTVWSAPVGTAFPAVDEAPGEAWTLLGSNGDRSYANGGVTVAQARQYASSTPAAATGSSTSWIEGDGIRVRIELLDLTLEQYAVVLGQNAVAVTPAVPGIAGIKTIGLAVRTGRAAEFAVLARGPSPYADGMAAQYELPRCTEVGSPQPVFRKGVPAGLVVELMALEDPLATSEETRFGRLVAQFEAALTPLPVGLHFLAFGGQSNNQGNFRGANHTFAQEYGLIAFPRQSTSPTAYQPALATSVSVTGQSLSGPTYPNGEMPMFGMSYVGELIEHLYGLQIDEVGMRLLVACNATGATSIAQNSKGGSTGNFERVISQAASTLAIATAEGVPAYCDAVFWNQGEQNNGDPIATHKAALVALRSSYHTDIRANIPGSSPVKLILNQTNSATLNSASIPRAQFEAQAENPDIIMATPQYMVSFADSLHPVARDSKWLGAYAALAWYYTIIVGERWQPLHFELEEIVGTDVILRAVGATGPLVIDETTIPAQTIGNMVRGYTCLTSGGAAVPVTAVQLGDPGTLVVSLANYAPGHRLRYALDPAVSRPSPVEGGTAYTGGAGNIRDSLGSVLPMFRGNEVNRPMDRWAAGQEIIV